MSLRENPGTAISGGAHVVLLLAALISFSRAPRFDDASESVPVEMVSDQEFNQIMKGEKTAQQKAKPQQRVEKLADLAETKPVSPLPEAKTDVATPPPQAKREQDPGRDETKDIPTPPERSAIAPPPRPVEEPVKSAPKPEPVKPAAAAPAPVKPPPPDSAEAIEPKAAPSPKVPPKIEAKDQPATEPKPVERPKKLEPKFKPDEVAKLLDQTKPKDPPPKPTPKPKSGDEAADPIDKFDVGDISKFLNKDAPQRKAATGSELQQVASLGSPTASAAKMSPSLWGQLDGLLQEQYKRCWNYVGLGGLKYVPEIHVQYAEDGALIGQPSLLNPPSDPALRGLAESAVRAVRRCNPLRIPVQFQPYYDQWKGRIVRFDPEDML
ncbi:MAG: cell envelope biogenesis protein TolA [Methylocella sp.]